MTGVDLKPADDLHAAAGLIVADIRARLTALMPGLEVHHVGATAMPASVTKGDVDVVVSVSSAQLAAVVEALRPRFTEKQRENWTPEFASFGDDGSYALPVGVQVVVRDSENDIFVFLRDYFIAHPDELKEYDRLKIEHASEGPQAYWHAKDEFLSRILVVREDAARGQVSPPAPAATSAAADD